MTRIALLGTGDLGAPIARRLSRSGFDVRAHNRTRAKAEPLADDGVHVADTPAEAADGANVLITVLANGDVVRAVAPEAFDALADDAIWVQSATVGADAADDLAGLASDAGVTYVDAPVSGGAEDAEAGRLAVLASGPDAALDRLRPVFDAIGRKTVRAGDAGAGSRLKLVVNTWLMAMVEGLGESIALAEGLRIDPRLLLETLDGGPLDVAYAQAKGPAMIERSYDAGTGLELSGKDMRLARTAVEELGLDIPLPGMIAERIARGVASGYEDRDSSVLVELARKP